MKEERSPKEYLESISLYFYGSKAKAKQFYGQTWIFQFEKKVKKNFIEQDMKRSRFSLFTK